jgi:hypothetical protein
MPHPDMLHYTIETMYHLPVYRRRTYRAATVAQACRLAIEDEEWAAGSLDHDSAGETFVTGIWEGADAAWSGSPLPVPAHFEEEVQRKAGHFETLLELLKMMLADMRAGRASSEKWIERAKQAVGLGEAIIAGARGPDPQGQDGDPLPDHGREAQEHMSVAVTDTERDAVLTGLRLLQQALEADNLAPLLRDILTNGGAHPGLDPESIDTLCERLNA